MAQPRVVLFDLDETLVVHRPGRPWEITLLAALDAACPRPPGACEHSVLADTLRQRRAAIWRCAERQSQARRDARATFTQLLRDACATHGLAADETACRSAAEALLREQLHRIVPAAGATEVLARLADQGVPMALVSNGDAWLQREKLALTGLGRYFPTLVFESEIGHGKPDERPFRVALDRVGATPDEATMVGDNYEFDIVASHRLGMRTVWVNPAGRKAPCGGATVGRELRTLRDW